MDELLLLLDTLSFELVAMKDLEVSPNDSLTSDLHDSGSWIAHP
jgi:hypothetical protein